MVKSLAEIAAGLVGLDLRDYNFDGLTVLSNEQPVTAVMSLDEIREFVAAHRERAQADDQMGRRTWNG